MTWNIVCDSSADLPSAGGNDDAIRYTSVPLRLLVGEQEFLDDESLTISRLLECMKEEKGASSTACPSPAAFAQAFSTTDCSICFTISSNLSGTCSSAMMGRDLALEEHPEKKICVIDSKSTAGCLVLLARRARALIEQAEVPNFEEICAQLRIYQAALRTTFTLENFDNLIKNGRMRPLVGNLLHSLGIHVIAEATPQGTIHVADKARGETKTFQAIIKQMSASKDCTGAEVIISHCQNLPGAVKLKELILKDLPVKSVELLSCRGLTSFYAMEKGLILCY
ncbi:Fatty acid-binding protein [anaerobic digester metagenome]